MRKPRQSVFTTWSSPASPEPGSKARGARGHKGRKAQPRTTPQNPKGSSHHVPQGIRPPSSSIHIYTAASTSPELSRRGHNAFPLELKSGYVSQGAEKGRIPPAQSYQIGNWTQSKAQRTKWRGPDFANCRTTGGAAGERLKQGQGPCTPRPPTFTRSWILGVAPELCALHTTGDPANCAWSGSLRDPVETAPRS